MGTWPLTSSTGIGVGEGGRQRRGGVEDAGTAHRQADAGPPVARAQPSAMNAAACSCRARTWRIADCRYRAS